MITLTLPDMTCGHCVKSVTAAVQQLDPAATLAFDLPTHEVRIQSAQPEAQIKAVLAAEGYPAA
ncbi:heavy-metal-associated domain-containing protein [Ideonella sp.]|uniref:heavy-metal-associated domain-containing protein n=1 Tax=Ideonella sp. TaxID=1929293 RepID=UPI003BB6632C